MTTTEYYDWEGFICRTTGDIFTGSCKRFIVGKGWQTAHYADCQEKGVMLTKESALKRLFKINGFEKFAAKAKHYEHTKH